MIGAVMFLGGFFASLLAFYGRNAPLLMLAVILLAFCWVGNERVHKAFRAIPITLLSLLGVITTNLSHTFIFDMYYYLPTICFLVVGFLLVSLLPTKTKKMPPSRVASLGYIFTCWSSLLRDWRYSQAVHRLIF